MKVPKSSFFGAASPGPDKARLVIESVVESDKGRYKCRADFKKSPTKNYRMELKVLGESVASYASP